MGAYKCIECGEIIEHKCCCAKHHLETKHEKFELVGTDISMSIKTS